MPSKIELVRGVLDNLQREEEILAAALAQRGLPPLHSSLPVKIKQLEVWRLVEGTINEAFSVFARFAPYGSDKLYIELADYVAMFYRVTQATVLVCIIPPLANRGLLEVEIENARLEIQNILGRG